MKTTALLLPLAVSLSFGCKKEQPPPAPAPVHAATPAEDPKAEVRLLITGDEYGWLLRSPDGDKPSGGAAEVLGQWTAEEKHCVGDPAKCTNAMTLALSTGDPAISSYFQGKPAFDAMKAMGYAASALGNHELDFGKDAFVANRESGGFPVLAANVKATDAAQDLQLPASQVFERNGLKIAVIGLAFENAGKVSMAGKFEGQQVEGYETALQREVPKAWEAGADAVVVLVDDCPTAIKETLEKNAALKITVLAGGHCNATLNDRAGNVALVSPGRRFQSYARVNLSFDKSKPAGAKLVDTGVSVVEMSGATAAADERLAGLITAWKEKVDAQLGTQIGFASKGLAQDSPQLSKWVLESWRSATQADVALMNRKAIRQGLPAGNITKATVYSVLPWENSLVVAKVKGEHLIAALQNPEALFSGATKAGKAFKDAKGKTIDPKRDYTVATSDYVYFGGDGFALEKADPLPTETGMMCQTPVIEWTQKQNTNDTKPLEKTLGKG
ncbi:MAG: bifunctional metallophosphatase/5'-nucleotidase [Myxococcaceae bacterium]